jgi:hypothetical protein
MCISADAGIRLVVIDEENFQRQFLASKSSL